MKTRAAIACEAEAPREIVAFDRDLDFEGEPARPTASSSAIGCRR